MALLPKSGKKKGPGIRLDMTPMVDVAFLLLIFFISTTTLRAHQDSTITLPTAQSGDELPREEKLVVRVEEDGSVFFSSDGTTPQAIAVEDLGEAVLAARERDAVSKLLVFADGDVPYSTMSDVLNAFRQSEIYRFSLVTDVEEEEQQ